MKNARKLLDKAGLPLYLLAIFFVLIKNTVLLPIMSKIWEMTLRTTPYGFISNANLGETILKSPWIILIGICLLGVFVFFSVWQVAAVILDVAYNCEKKKIRVRDVLRLSFMNLMKIIRPKNGMILIYIIILIPFSDVFQASEYIGRFVVPEYIQDYINAHTILFAMYSILFIVAGHFVLRWIYLLPAFFLKGFDYKKASKESFEFTKKCTLKNGIKLAIYGFMESIRLAVVPNIIIILVCLVTYLFVREQPYAFQLADFPKARIPSLEEVIATYSNTTPILIEIKGYKNDENLPAKIVALLEEYDCAATSMIHSGDYAALRAVKLCNPNIKCGLIQAIITGNCYDLPYMDFLSVEHSFVTSKMIDQLHIRDKELYVWTVNYKESVTQLKFLDIDGYITDYPDDIAETLKCTNTLFEGIFNTIKGGVYDSMEAKKQYEEGTY